MSRRLWPPAALAMVAIVAVISAGCGSTGSSGGTSTTASAGNTGTASSTDSSGGNSTASPHAKAVKFAECMRANGVSAFPDPDATGALTIETVANGTSIDTDSAAFGRAVTACKDLQPPGFTGYERSPEQQKVALKFAQCMRDNGVKDFPDPGPDDPIIDTNRIPSANRPGGMSILDAATGKCEHFLAGAGVTGGR
jgi:hypothetical protein